MMDTRLFASLQGAASARTAAAACVAVAGHPTEPGTFYFGACAGGVWKTTNAGSHWLNVSDGFFNTAAVGGLAVPTPTPTSSTPGRAKRSIRSNVSHGDGVYRSDDGGRSWRNMGLAATRHISQRRRPSDRPGHRVCRCARPRLGTQSRARRLPLARRRRDMGPGAAQERPRRRGRPDHGPDATRACCTPRCGRAGGTRTPPASGGEDSASGAAWTAATPGPT